jgi:hypothetical protein
VFVAGVKFDPGGFFSTPIYDSTAKSCSLTNNK